MRPENVRPYVAFDLETTGVDVERVHILEIGAVFDDGVSPLAELPTFNVLIKENSYEYCEPYAMQLNYQVLKEIATKKTQTPLLKPGEALLAFRGFCLQVEAHTKAWDKKHVRGYAGPSFSFAGKNASSFDFPILHVLLKRIITMPEKESGIDLKTAVSICDSFTIGRWFLKRRFIDLGSMFYDKFGYIPSQDEIMKYYEWEKVNHRAKDDAMQVVRAIRAHWEEGKL